MNNKRDKKFGEKMISKRFSRNRAGPGQSKATTRTPNKKRTSRQKGEK